MLILSIILGFLVVVKAGPATEIASYKGQFCTDPRTMRRHAAYTEWADAYSCTRHRCQPGGRNLAIYTVGCKRVEAPESAIECEEVVEDTNMQFPYCCTRLRCLVVVRGEVWTRVLGQPWETLPAAPWSHMYKMKKPPPGSEGSFMPKPEEGPVYELQSPEATEQSSDDKVLRSEKKPEAECNDGATRVIAGPPPDIVIALSTGSEKGLGRKNRELDENNKLKRRENRNNNVKVFEEAEPETRNQDYPPTKTEKEKTPEPLSEERYGGSYLPEKQQQASLEPEEQQQETEAPQPLWNDHDQQPENDQANQHGNDWEERERKRREPVSESLTMPSESPFMNKIEPTQNWETQPPAEPDFVPPHIQKEMRRSEDKEGGKVEHTGSLQALVDAIGTRMRDIETVVAKMNEKVQNEKAEIADKGLPISTSMNEEMKYYDGQKKTKKSASNSEHYKRGGSKYVHGSGDYTTEPPLFVEDSNLNGYFNDASNNVIRRAPKEPAETMTYMAPVPEVKIRRKLSYNEPNEHESKRKKRVHKKKHMKSHHKKHHGKEDKRRKFRVNSVEKGAVSLEDSSAGNAGMNINNGTFDNMID